MQTTTHPDPLHRLCVQQRIDPTYARMIAQLLRVRQDLAWAHDRIAQLLTVLRSGEPVGVDDAQELLSGGALRPTPVSRDVVERVMDEWRRS